MVNIPLLRGLWSPLISKNRPAPRGASGNGSVWPRLGAGRRGFTHRTSVQLGALSPFFGVSPTLERSSGFHPPQLTRDTRGFTHPRTYLASGLRPPSGSLPVALESADRFRGFTHPGQPVDNVGGSATSASGFRPPKSRGFIHQPSGFRPPARHVHPCNHGGKRGFRSA